MELKLLMNCQSENGYNSSNRTFMELKLEPGQGRDPTAQVLIVPLWN